VNFLNLPPLPRPPPPGGPPGAITVVCCVDLRFVTPVSVSRGILCYRSQRKSGDQDLKRLVSK
jgi:hypothetical protein